MLNLIRADILRIRKGKAFYICSFIMAFMGFTSKTETGSDPLEISLLSFVPVAVFVTASYISLFLGDDYANGTIRCKLSKGNKRVIVYLAGLTVSLCVNILMCVIYDIFYLIGSFPSGASFERSSSKIALFILCSFTVMAAWTAIFTFIGMLCSSKAYSTAACILTALVLIIIGISVESKLMTFDTQNAVEYAENAGNEPHEKTTEQKIYEFASDFSPGSQTLNVSGMASEHPWRIVIYDTVIFAALTCSGIAAFNKKLLK